MTPQWLSAGGLAALVLIGLTALGPARADAPPDPARVLAGIATTSSGRPLAHATLYLFGLPPGLTDMITLGDQSTVVTDDRGRFTWAIPAGLPPLSFYVGVRSIDCYALAADRSVTQFRLALRPNLRGTDAEAGDRFLLAEATRRCETKWQSTGPPPVLSVVVPDTGDVLLTVRGPDGGLLRGRAVEVAPPRTPGAYGGAVVYAVQTDEAGRLRLRLFPGPMRLKVFAPGVGYGSTGAFEVTAGATATPPVPPLAPFAQVSGTVPAGLAGPGAAVHSDEFGSENDWYDPHGAVDAEGRWTVGGLLSGPHRLVLSGGHEEAEAVSVTVDPGQHLGGVAFAPVPASPPTAPSLGAASLPSARGRVMDSDGRPVAGVDVYAESFRYQTQKVLTVKTDAAGHYLIPDVPVESGWSPPSVHLVAHQPDFGLAVADAQVEKGQTSGRWLDVQKDLVLPAAHSSLTVRVLQDGKPLPDALVETSPDGQNWATSLLFHGSDRGEAAQALRQLLYPSARTGPDGAARFADLTPGLWGVAANRPTGFWFLTPMPTTPFNVSPDVAVQAGEDLTYTVSVHPPPGPVTFRVLAPDGQPAHPFPKDLALETARNPNYPGYGSLFLRPAGAGDGKGDFFTPGLYRVRARFGNVTASDSIYGPFNEGTTLVAASPATAARPPVVIPTRRVGPSSIHVRLEDERGRPLRGTVSVTTQYREDRYAASADAQGRIVFPDVPTGAYTLTARLAGRPERTPLGRGNDPLPSDASLVAGTGQPLPQTVIIRGGEQAEVTFRSEPPGYVRLRVAGVPPGGASGYSVEARQPSDRDLIDTRLDTGTGEFVIGPLPPGPRTFYLFRLIPPPAAAYVPAGGTPVTVKAGQIVHATLVAHELPVPPLLRNSLVLTGTVLMPDGKTPAWGARAGLFTADRPFPLPMARADAAGRLTLRDFWRDTRRPTEPAPGNPAGPVLAAWLPGANGAVIVPYVPGQDARLVLPPALALRGRVTVGGQPVTNLPSSFRVRAECEGRGTLNEALSVEATAQADGTFELAGLTPGTYRVQAARDDVWLSGAQTVTVGTGPPADLTLDIKPPGLPVVLHLQDGQGRALTGREVSVVRPEGPLTAQIWPRGLKTDGAGDLRLDGLEAGPHRLTVAGFRGGTAGFDVPEWTPNAPPVARRVVLGQ